MDWSELNEQYRQFDELYRSLCKEFKINLDNDYQLNQLKVDLSSYKEKNLLSYSILVPNQLRPVTYRNRTDELLNELINDEWFKSTGLILRTLEKGVPYPVIHYSTIYNNKENKNDQSIELLRPNRFGLNYTLIQAIYEEIYTMELPVITKKISKEVNYDSMKNTMTNTINNDETDKFQSFDYLSSDSGCVSLNSTSNDYSSLEETKQKTTNLHNSIESLNSSSYDSSYDSSNDLTNDSTNSSVQKSKKNKSKDYPIKINQLNHKLMNNQLISFHSILNNGHLLIGFRMKDKFFQQIFEQYWYEMCGARCLSNLVAAKFGLKRLKFLRRIALNTRRKDKEYDDGTTFVYILHAEFHNLTDKNEIFFLNFIHRLQLKTFGSINLYTNLLTN